MTDFEQKEKKENSITKNRPLHRNYSRTSPFSMLNYAAFLKSPSKASTKYEKHIKANHLALAIWATTTALGYLLLYI